MIAVSPFAEITIFRRMRESLDSLLGVRKQTPQGKSMREAWRKGANDAIVNKKQNPYPKGSDRFNSYETGHKSQWWLN